MGAWGGAQAGGYAELLRELRKRAEVRTLLIPFPHTAAAEAGLHLHFHEEVAAPLQRAAHNERCWLATANFFVLMKPLLRRRGWSMAGTAPH
jgi:hypothetical protein